MRFRKGARLDRSQVEDLRGRRMGGAPVALGGGGIVALVVVLAFILLGGSPLGDGGLGPLTDLAGRTAGTGSPAATLDHCQTGQDANQYEDCRVLAVVNSVQAYWTDALRGYEPTRTRFFDGRCRRAAAAQRRPSAPSTARPPAMSTSTSASSTSSSPSSALREGRSRRPTS